MCYTCVMACVAGQPLLDEATVPPSLTGLDAQAIDDTSIRITWQPPPGGRRRYHVQLRPHDKSIQSDDVKSIVTYVACYLWLVY